MDATHQRGSIAASLERRFLQLYVAALVLTTVSSTAMTLLLDDVDALFVTVTLIEFFGLLVLGVKLLFGVAILFSTLAFCIATSEPSSTVVMLPVAGLMLSWRRPRLWKAALALLLGFATLHVLATERPDFAWMLIGVLAFVSALGALAGHGLRAAFAAITHADATIANTQQAPDEVRRDERESLASELVDVLERDLTVSAQSHISAGASATELQNALMSAVDEARSSLLQLRALVSTLRATDPEGVEPHPAETVQEAMELAEDHLTGHGFSVELPLTPAAKIPASQATILASFFREAAENIMRHAAPGSTVTFAHNSTRDGVVAEVVNDSDDVSGRWKPGAGLRSLEERMDLAGGTLEAGPDHGRWTLRATLPLTPHQLSRKTALDSPAISRGPLAWAARNTKLIFSCALAAWVILQLLIFIADPSWTDVMQALEGTMSLVTPIVILIGIHHAPLGIALSAAFAGLLLVAHPSLQVDSWLIAAAVIYALVRLNGRRQLIALFVILLYSAVRVLSQASPLLELLGLLQLAIPVSAVAMTIMVLNTVSLAKQSELQALAREQRTIRQAERRTLAGELHDVLAHHLSLVVLEAEQHIATTDITTLRRAHENVLTRTQAALVDLSMLAFILREEDAMAASVPNEHGPTRSSAGLEVAIREHGFTHSADVDPELDHLDRTIQRTVVRILRESVTNALRYAKEGSHIVMRAAVEPTGVTVQVTSDLGSSVKDRSGLSTGLGLHGLAQRVSLLGGEFDAGPCGTQWIVDAKLPSELRPGALAS